MVGHAQNGMLRRRRPGKVRMPVRGGIARQIAGQPLAVPLQQEKIRGARRGHALADHFARFLLAFGVVAVADGGDVGIGELDDLVAELLVGDHQHAGGQRRRRQRENAPRRSPRCESPRCAAA